MCRSGKHFSLWNLDKYYRRYWKSPDVSTKKPPKKTLTRHFLIFYNSLYLYQVFFQSSKWIYFPVDPLLRVVVCVLQYQRTHLHMVRVCPKVHFWKNTGIFDDGSIKVLKVKIKVEILEKWNGNVLKIQIPRDPSGAIE